jgi:hypothetical protein
LQLGAAPTAHVETFFNAGTITATRSWTNNGSVAITHSEIRLNAGNTFYNYNRVTTGSSISGNFFNAGTFTLTDDASITGDGITTGVLRGSGTYTISPTSGEATFTSDITSTSSNLIFRL